ncbi:DUF2971 domain-containing protein [Moritella sp. F3]|uniref:DUF2971 domain-containing protein n=1 Tax=Moritella sp. F3 TaxID=2718882 RepID=UPI0018E15871|nr:DUF2971 domain-containing protein [Moritella sp. F3]GIC79711.1 hypothetical protein FMO001_44380 [Moritella sp. F1]GIC79788.1 hypothetical protein FMO003_00690 [Moritella sp. F3]
MQHFLYKYTKLREDFFVEPFIRATQVESLNDPFEVKVTLQQIIKARMASNTFHGIEEELDKENFEYMMDEFLGISQQDLSEIGIISLTEDPVNTLMWSHYADEHRGIAVQFRSNGSFFDGAIEDFAGIRNKYREDYSGLVNETPQVIAYRKNRPQFDFIEEVAAKDRGDYPHKKFNQQLIYTKANDWIYEKERRSVVYLYDADRIVCDVSDDIVEICKKNNIEHTVENLRIEINYPTNFGYSPDILDVPDEIYDQKEIKHDVYHLSRKRNAFYFFKLSKDMIPAIVFGCNVDKQVVENIKKKLTWNPELFITKPSVDTFELEIEKL